MTSPKKLALATAALLGAVAALEAQTITWSASSPDNVWSNTASWTGGNVPDTNAETAQYGLTLSNQITVDSNFTIKTLLDGFSGEGATLTLGGPGTLRIDVNASAATVGIDNATGNAGGTLRFTGNVLIQNSSTGVTTIRNANSASNVTVFEPGSVLTLNTILQTVNSAGGQIRMNGTFGASTADMQINSNNLSFGVGHDSSNYGKDFVFFANSRLTVDAGTVLNTGRKFQVNGTGASLVLNGAGAINFANVNVGGTHNFLLDVNASQPTMGALADIGGNLTIDLGVSVSTLAFLNSAEFAANWTGGTVTLVGFREGVIRFGTDASGLTAEQLLAFSGATYGLTDTGFLTVVPEPSTVALLSTLLGIGALQLRRRRR